jgi:hypothetical protein
MRGRRIVVSLVVAALAGCSRGEAAGRLAALPGSAASLDALGQGIVDGFVKGDTARVKGYTLSLAEYRDVVWPRLGIDPASGMNFDFSWRDNAFRGGRAYGRYRDRLKGRSLRALHTRCTGKTDRYRQMTILRDCHVVVRTETGASEEMKLFRSVVVIGGGHKIFRYDD